MTRKELINFGELFLEVNHDSKNSNTYKFIDAALKLFKQQPNDDCISRQAVLDQTYLWSKDEFLRVTNPFDYLRKRINLLPPVTPQQSCEDIAKAFQLGLAFGFGEKYDEMGRVIDELKKAITPQYTDAEIQKMQEMEQAEIQKAYELGKEDKQAGEEAKTFNVLQFVADNAGLSTFEAIEKAYNMGVSEQESVLDKARAEIEGLTYYWCEVNPNSVKEDVLEIIDKYKESEE